MLYYDNQRPLILKVRLSKLRIKVFIKPIITIMTATLRNKNMRTLVILMALFIITLPFTSCTQSSTTDTPITTTKVTTPVSIGDMAPDFTLEDLEGNLFTLSDFLGSPVIINFWLTT